MKRRKNYCGGGRLEFDALFSKVTLVYCKTPSSARDPMYETSSYKRYYRLLVMKFLLVFGSGLLDMNLIVWNVIDPYNFGMNYRIVPN